MKAKMIGYKIAKHGDKRVVITLKIPCDALTNINRPSIVVKVTAKYRTNKAKVLNIEDGEGNCYTTATSFCYEKKSLDYKVGEVIEEPTYNADPEKICAQGIHYFLSRRVAKLYSLGENTYADKKRHGLYQAWYENGQKHKEMTFADGKKHGLYQAWYENGQKHVEITFVDGKEQGLYQEWYENGQKHVEITFADGKKHGLWQQWFENGQKFMETTYVDGEMHGPHQLWYENGQICEECFYVNGEREGLCQSWYENGQKHEECDYSNGGRNIHYKEWSEDGTKIEEYAFKPCSTANVCL